MKKFLENLQLSEEAIKIYLESVEKGYFTFYELFSLVPNLSPEDFERILNELMEINLILKIPSQDPELLDYYVPIPPFKPILDFYSNIETNIPEIKTQINDLMIKNVNKVFKKSKKIELETLNDSIKEIRKDYQEDLLLERKDIEEVSKELNVLKEIDEVFDELYQKIKSLTQVQFGKLIKILTGIKTKIIDKIKPIELKKNEEEIINIVEDVFKQELQTMVTDFNETLNKLIEEEFDKVSIEETIEKAFQYRDDLKMVLRNIANNFEMKINRIADLVNEKQENLHKNIEELREEIISNLDVIVQNSLDQVAALNKPIIRVINDYLDAHITPERIKVKDIWTVKSITKINEEIINSINHAKNSLTLILPKLEEHVSPDLFGDLPEDLMIKVAASNFHVNSLVKEYKSIDNLNYRKLENEDLIFILRDNNYIILGTKKESDDPLEDFIGIGTNFLPFVNILKTVITSTWSKAKPDLEAKMRRGGPQRGTTKRMSGRERLKPAQTTESSPKPKKEKLKAPVVEPTVTQKSTEPKGVSAEKLEKEIRPDHKKPAKEKGKVQEIPETVPEEHEKEESGHPETPKQPIATESAFFQSSISPEPGDQVGMEINVALNKVLKNLSGITGEELAKYLEDLADLILEKKGFSVTLHKIRSKINQYKKVTGVLNGEEANDVYESIEDWKEHLL
ncbi:MAG: hypothetical protein BAJALOKI2v1_50002 [Promethearchaeota archaeon]|nr:MAG: hypothetical protein BAJALOKI2v1_50002 [Candidatus Lokiarchaeota archaeon]